MEAETESEVTFRRALVSIGVDRVVKLDPLESAASGARSVAAGAKKQGCDVELFVDDAASGSDLVRRGDILDSIGRIVERRIYDQLIWQIAARTLSRPTVRSSTARCAL